MELNEHFWEQKYQERKTGWDIGRASTPIIAYLEQLDNKELSILIPGCGNGYEAEWAHKNGFKNVHILDFASSAIANFKKRYPHFEASSLHQEDFFNHEGKYDIIIEQTFFCSLDPSMRKQYAEKMQQLLNPNGRLIGLLFNTDFEDGPPFGGDKDEYKKYFSPYFFFKYFENCYNSIKPRAGTELFMVLKRKVT
jgi:2-polyprenyl-3-methyl-5-hydroxy-6-metoxy-1,4-benzoquinol methylase